MARFGEAQTVTVPSDLETPIQIPQRRFGGSPELQRKALQERERREGLRRSPSFLQAKENIRETREKIFQLDKKEQTLVKGIEGMRKRGLDTEGAEGELEGTREARTRLRQTLTPLTQAKRDVGRLLIAGRESDAKRLALQTEQIEIADRVDPFIRARERQARNIGAAQRIFRRRVEKVKGVEEKIGKPISEITIKEAQELPPQLRKQLGIEIVKRPVSDENIIFVNGLGFSVAKEKQAEFLRTFPGLKPRAVSIKEEEIRIVAKAEKPKGLEKTLFDIRRFNSEIQTRKMRGERVSAKEEAQRLAGQAIIPLISAPLFVAQTIKEPKATLIGVKETGVKFVSGEGFPEVGRFAREDPTGFTARVAGEIVLLKGTGQALKFTEKVAEIGRARISPRFKRITTETEEITKIERQAIKDIEVKKGADIEIGLIPKGTEIRIPTTTDPAIRGGFGFTTKEQFKFTKVRGPIVTAQEDFVKLLEKPLERELFATPPVTKEIGAVRVSRLGLQQQQAKLSDILFGEVTFKKTKPQIIVFPDELVGRKGGFQPQIKGSELETILPAGEIPKRVGTVGVAVIERRRVPIIEAEIGKASKELTDLLAKRKPVSQLSQTELTKLRKETRFDFSDFSKRFQTKPFVSPKRVTTPLVTFVKTIKPIRSIRISTKQFRPGTFDKPVTLREVKTPILPKPITAGKSPTAPKTKAVRIPSKITATAPLVRTPLARPAILPPPIPQIKTPRFPRVRRRKKPRFRDDAALVQSFTAKILKLPPLKIPVSKISAATPKFQTIGIRPAPIIIPDVRMPGRGRGRGR